MSERRFMYTVERVPWMSLAGYRALFWVLDVRDRGMWYDIDVWVTQSEYNLLTKKPLNNLKR